MAAALQRWHRADRRGDGNVKHGAVSLMVMPAGLVIIRDCCMFRGDHNVGGVGVASGLALALPLALALAVAVVWCQLRWWR